MDRDIKGRFTKGNRFAYIKKNSGRPRTYKKPNELLMIGIAYFSWAEKENNKIYSLKDMRLFIGIESRAGWYDYRHNDKYRDVILTLEKKLYKLLYPENNILSYPENNIVKNTNISCIVKKITKNSKVRHKQGLISQGINKKFNTNIIYTDVNEFILYIEKQFTKKMNWDNYGTYWQIDHIIPVSKFNLNDEHERNQCFHFTNMQPLYKIDNVKKHAKLTDPQLKLIL